ncbi:MAG: phosphodiester glycosidase family protein [Pseudomonadota bacterium]|nr:phosphodiester glycosidase family protein [Pseudomonadota bacterium]
MRNFLLILFAVIVFTPNVYGAWTPLAPGMELGSFAASKPSLVGDSRITILRINPKLWELVLTGKSWGTETKNQTAKGWCESHGFTAAINAGMFGDNYETHLGYLASKGHVNNGHVNKYMSVAAFGPKPEKKLPEFRIFDLDDPAVTMESILSDFSSVVQNLRLIKRPGENRWSQQDKMWSEAALGEDSSGRILFIFSRSPFSMHNLNLELLGLGISLVAAQHLEGGPEAQLYLRIGAVTYEMFGSYETAFCENDENTASWLIPNVIGIRPRP